MSFSGTHPGRVPQSFCPEASGDMLPNRTATRPIQLSYVEDAVRVIEAVGQAVTQTLR